MPIPDPIYDDFYFSSPKNQEIILGVFETFKADLLLKCKEAVGEEVNDTNYVRNHVLPPHKSSTLLNAERKGWNSCRSTTLKNLENLSN